MVERPAESRFGGSMSMMLPLPVTAPADDAARTHTVVDGDTLAALAERYLGSSARADEIYQANVIRFHDFLDAVAGWLDRWIIAGIAVRGTHGTTELFGRALRLLQTGNLQTYAFLFALGVALVLYLALK